MQWKRPKGIEQRAAETVVHDDVAGTEEGTRQFNDFNLTGDGVQAARFGVGGLIQAAVGLSGGVGAWLTHRSRFSAKARSRVCCRAACTASICP